MSNLTSAIVKGYNKFESVYGKCEMFFMAFSTLIIGFLIIVEVVLRAFNFQGFKWLEEVSRFMLIATTITGCSMAVKDNGHMIMDAIFSVLSAKASHILKALVNLLSGLFYLYIAFNAISWTQQLVKIGKTMDSMGVPYFYIWILFSISLTTMGMRYIVEFIKSIEKYRNNVDFNDANQKEM